MKIFTPITLPNVVQIYKNNMLSDTGGSDFCAINNDTILIGYETVRTSIKETPITTIRETNLMFSNI